MDEKTQRQQLEILKVLKEYDKPLGSIRIAEALSGAGIELNSRTLRFHLARMDELGLTRKISRRMGRVIAQRGLLALESSDIVRRMKFIVSQIDSMSFDMTFDLSKLSGTLIVNFSHVPMKELGKALNELDMAFRAGLGMGRLALMRMPGESIGGAAVPRDHVGIGTVCNVSLNGILLKQGIPMASRYGCLLRIEREEPVCFTEMVDYLGVTMDPLELFIKAGMTSVSRAARGLTGVVGASFREVPANAAKNMDAINRKLDRIGLGCILAVGKPNQPLLNVPVTEGMMGIALVGGLNPIAAAHEAGCNTTSTALHSFVDFDELQDFDAIKPRIAKLIK